MMCWRALDQLFDHHRGIDFERDARARPAYRAAAWNGGRNPLLARGKVQLALRNLG